MPIHQHNYVTPTVSYIALFGEMMRGENEALSKVHKEFFELDEKTLSKNLAAQALTSTEQTSLITSYVAIRVNAGYTENKLFMEQYAREFIHGSLKLEKQKQQELISVFVDEVALLFNNTSSLDVADACHDTIFYADHKCKIAKNKEIDLDARRAHTIFNKFDAMIDSQKDVFPEPEPWANLYKYIPLKIK